MRILGIETSCDETAVALLSGQGDSLKVEASLVRSQIDLHAVYGGVVPEVAAREHLAMLFPMLHQVVPSDGSGIDAVAVTAGPGLAPALRVGVEAARALAHIWQKPLVSTCHLEGHIYAAWLGTHAASVPVFPALALIVSGGHTELILMRDHGQFTRLGETLDDAAGEAFDKVAKMLGLGYPGGPKLAALAETGQATAFSFPRALLKSKELNFSFSGLKTSVLYTLRENEERLAQPEFMSDIAASFQAAVVDVLVSKTEQALRAEPGVKSIILAGGVAANLALREQLKKTGQAWSLPVFLPDLPFALDNAAMIAAAGYFRAMKKDFVTPELIKVEPNRDIV